MSRTIIDESGSCTAPRVRDAWGWPRQDTTARTTTTTFRFPFPADRGSAAGRAILDRRPAHIRDVRAGTIRVGGRELRGGDPREAIMAGVYTA